MAQRARGEGAAGRPRARTSVRANYAGAGSSRGAGARAERVEEVGPPPLRPQELVALRARLRALVEPVVVAEGLDLEDVQVSRAGRRYLVRVTIDAEGGIGHDELSDVSRAVSDALDEAEERSGELTPTAYTLELSSPGVDRPLTLPRHWRRNVGRLVSVKIGTRTVTGRVLDADDQTVRLEVDGSDVVAPFADLGAGRVQVEFNRLAELADEELGPEIVDDADQDIEEFDGDEREDEA